MGLISHNTNTNILIAIEYTVTLLAAGYSRENIIVNLGKKKFGDVSNFSKSASERIEEKGYHDALTGIFEKHKHSNLRRFISILNAEDSIDISPMLNDLSYQIMKEKSLTAENLIDNLTSRMQKTMMIAGLPIVIFFVIIIQGAFPGTEFVPRPQLDHLVYGIALLLLLVLMIRMRYDED